MYLEEESVKTIRTITPAGVFRECQSVKIIAAIYNWNPGDVDEVCVIIRDWKQNGYDCGPTGCAVIQMCMENGIEATWSMLSECSLMNPPPLPCGHILIILLKVSIYIQRLWSKTKG